MRFSIATAWSSAEWGGVIGRRERRFPFPGQPNDLWCADYKGEFMLADRRYCYPLTITDFASRYLFACEALSTTKDAYAFPVFKAVFKEFGLPKAIRTDNGVPFASPNALFGLSKVSVWWLRLGIEIERIKPGNPQQNGRHERMHLTLKLETTKPAGNNFLQQQAKFDDFIDCYNNERPHQALNMRNRYLRKLLVVGAHAVLYYRKPHEYALRLWAKKLMQTKPFKLVAVALANKTARIAFAIMRGRTTYGTASP
jgi:putative transposase